MHMTVSYEIVFIPSSNVCGRRPNGFVLFVHACVRPSIPAYGSIVNTISCRVFDTFSPDNDALWDRDKSIKFQDQKVTV